LLVWLMVVPAVVCSKSNYKPAAMIVLAVPAAIVVVWWVLRALLPYDAQSEEAMGIMVSSIAVGLSVLWLAGEELAAVGRLVRVVTALLVMLMVALVAVVGAGIGLTWFTAQLWLMGAILAVIALGGYVMVSWRCRDDFSIGRLILWAAAGMTATAMAMAVLYMPIALILKQDWQTVRAVPIGAIVFTLIVFIVNLPFIAVAIWCPLYRRRLEGCLDVE